MKLQTPVIAPTTPSLTPKKNSSQIGTGAAFNMDIDEDDDFYADDNARTTQDVVKTEESAVTTSKPPATNDEEDEDEDDDDEEDESDSVCGTYLRTYIQTYAVA